MRIVSRNFAVRVRCFGQFSTSLGSVPPPNLSSRSASRPRHALSQTNISPSFFFHFGSATCEQRSAPTTVSAVFSAKAVKVTHEPSRTRKNRSNFRMYCPLVDGGSPEVTAEKKAVASSGAWTTLGAGCIKESIRYVKYLTLGRSLPQLILHWMIRAGAGAAPRAVRTMRKLTRIGVHTFYRPKRWGDGADAPTWGTAQSTADAAAKM